MHLLGEWLPCMRKSDMRIASAKNNESNLETVEFIRTKCEFILRWRNGNLTLDMEAERSYQPNSDLGTLEGEFACK